MNEQIDSRVFNILIADDNPTNLFLLKSILIQLLPNSKIMETINGKQAVEAVKLNIPDIIFMDAQMPEMNGYDATKSIRELISGKYLPILGVTAGTVKGEKEKCMEAGMNEYIPKPVIKSTIRKHIIKWLGEDNSEYPLKSKDLLNHFNKIELLERIDNDEDILENLLEEVPANFESSEQELSQNLDNKNISDIQSTISKLNEVAVSLCFNVLADLTNELEPETVFDEYKLRPLIEKIISEMHFIKDTIQSRNK
ncbi:MAG: response regulator [Leptospiraceae bacterium]|nr:response regulator [Leptospiraceae bacterium]